MGRVPARLRSGQNALSRGAALDARLAGGESGQRWYRTILRSARKGTSQRSSRMKRRIKHALPWIFAVILMAGFLRWISSNPDPGIFPFLVPALLGVFRFLIFAGNRRKVFLLRPEFLETNSYGTSQRQHQSNPRGRVVRH